VGARDISLSRFFSQGSSEKDSPALALDTAETERSGLGESTTTFSQIDQPFDCSRASERAITATCCGQCSFRWPIFTHCRGNNRIGATQSGGDQKIHYLARMNNPSPVSE
jgi:hypothetical protein